MCKIYQIAILLFLTLTLTNCKEEKEKVVQLNDEVQNDTLDTYFSKLYEAKMFNGAVAIKRKGKLIFKKGYGIANLKAQTSFLPNTSLEIASVSKQFTAAAILLLQQNHKLKVTDFAYKYLGEDFPYKSITISQLLSHTSGLADYSTYFKTHWDPSKIAYNKDILQYYKTSKPNLLSIPGEKYKYSNTGYIFLAEIVNATSGMTLEDYLLKKVFTPMHMENTFFIGRDSIWNKDNYAPGYMFNIENCEHVIPETLPNKGYYRFLSGRLGSGRLSSSVDDLIKWDQFLYSDSIFNKASKVLAFTPHPPTKEASDYGYGWHIKEDSLSGKVVFHTGSWAGNLTYISRSLDTKDLIIIVNNTYNSGYLKQIRASVNGFLNNEPLQFPKEKASELFKLNSCDLSEVTLDQWYIDHKDIDWDLENLQKLQNDYLKVGATDRSDMLSVLIKMVQADKNLL
ncbi:serine hydrolase [uncultured Formosa sp.]|uniref:serine hydrolase domain-containing protein n=1 Tax=uncultured Formosa sp. TaxID=255435 RepID=UPI002630ACD9|nr:serine hydrolase domain-containing protein [uncultured Formosa sp.]